MDIVTNVDKVMYYSLDWLCVWIQAITAKNENVHDKFLLEKGFRRKCPES